MSAFAGNHSLRRRAPFQTRHDGAPSVQTLNLFRTFGPNMVLSGTCGVTTAPDRPPAQIRGMLLRASKMPTPAEINLKPGGKIAGSVARRRAHVSQIAGAFLFRRPFPVQPPLQRKAVDSHRAREQI